MSPGGRPVADLENEEHRHSTVRKAEQKKRLPGLRKIVTSWAPNRIPLLSPRTDPTSPVADYGACKGMVHHSPTSTIQLYERSPGNEEVVAIKTFHRHPSSTTLSKCAPFSNNSILLSLNHPNIINVLDLLPDESANPCLVMEYCGGGDLNTLVNASSKLETAELDCVFKQVIRGVHYLHWNGIGHRNLRPGNILLTLAGTVKISDFDHAQYCADMLLKSPSRGQGSTSDSDPYMAPEVYNGGDADVSPIDVWALGILYTFLRTGRTPWDVAKEEDRMFCKYRDERIQTDGFEPIQSLGPVSICLLILFPPLFTFSLKSNKSTIPNQE